MSGGRASKAKGSRIERECVNLLQEAGLAAERVPLSGSVGGKYAGDISVPVLGIDRTLEVKCRASGWKQTYAWLADNYGLVIRADRAEPLIVLRLKDFAELAISRDRLWYRCEDLRVNSLILNDQRHIRRDAE